MLRLSPFYTPHPLHPPAEAAVQKRLIPITETTPAAPAPEETVLCAEGQAIYKKDGQVIEVYWDYTKLTVAAFIGFLVYDDIDYYAAPDGWYRLYDYFVPMVIGYLLHSLLFWFMLGNDWNEQRPARLFLAFVGFVSLITAQNFAYVLYTFLTNALIKQQRLAWNSAGIGLCAVVPIVLYLILRDRQVARAARAHTVACEKRGQAVNEFLADKIVQEYEAKRYEHARPDLLIGFPIHSDEYNHNYTPLVPEMQATE